MKILKFIILILLFYSCMTTKDANSQTNNKKIIAVVLKYYDAAKQTNSFFDVGSITLISAKQFFTGFSIGGRMRFPLSQPQKRCIQPERYMTFVLSGEK